MYFAHQQMQMQMLQSNFLLQHGYRVTRELGRGAFGCVYEAVLVPVPVQSSTLPLPPQPPLPFPAGVTECAIKKVSFARMGHVSARGQSTCTDELRIAQALEACPAPHVVRVYRTLVDTAEGAYYVVMERLRGNTLRDLVVRHSEYRAGLKDEYQLKNCVGSIVMGVLELERRGIVHRDIKPENVFVSDKGTWTEVKLIDFGLGRFVEHGGSELMQSMVGSPLYMTPELEQGGAYRWDCDLWGAGMCAYFLGTGQELVAVDTATYVEAKRAVWEQCTQKDYHFPGIMAGSGAERVLKKLLGKKNNNSSKGNNKNNSRCEEVLSDKWFDDCNLTRDNYCLPLPPPPSKKAAATTTTTVVPQTSTCIYQQQQQIVPTTIVPGSAAVYPQQQQFSKTHHPQSFCYTYRNNYNQKCYSPPAVMVPATAKYANVIPTAPYTQPATTTTTAYGYTMKFVQPQPQPQQFANVQHFLPYFVAGKACTLIQQQQQQPQQQQQQRFMVTTAHNAMMI